MLGGNTNRRSLLATIALLGTTGALSISRSNAQSVLAKIGGESYQTAHRFVGYYRKSAKVRKQFRSLLAAAEKKAKSGKEADAEIFNIGKYIVETSGGGSTEPQFFIVIIIIVILLLLPLAAS